MMKFIYWAIGVREPTNTINPNSMSPVPKNKFVNYARKVGKVDEDSEPHISHIHLKRMERLYGKSQRRKQQQEEYEKYEKIFDKFNY